MDIVVHTGSTRGLAHGKAFPAALTFESSEDEKAFLLLQVDAVPEAAKTLEEECVVIIRHALLGSEGEPWARLDGTLKELNGLFKGLLLSNAIEEIHAIVAILDKDGMLHVSHAGRGEAYLVRGGTAMQITEFAKGKPLSAFVHISSGALESGDVVILSTQRLLRTFSPTQLASLRSHADIVEEIMATLEAEHEVAAVASLRAPGQELEDLPMRGHGRGHGDADTRALAAERHARLHARAARRGVRSRQREGIWAYLPEWEYVASVLGGTGEWLWNTGKAVGRGGMALGKKAGARMKNGKGTGKGSGSDADADEGMNGASTAGGHGGRRGHSTSGSMLASASSFWGTLREKTEQFLADLRDPERKRRAHLLLLAGALAVFLLIWMLVSLTTSSQRSKSQAELEALMTQITEDIETADTRKLAGDPESANLILERAEGQAKQVMENDLGIYRKEALDLLDSIRQKREGLNNVVRLSPRVVVNVSSKNADVNAQGLIGIADGEFIIYDKQDAYSVLLNRLDDPERVIDDGLILRGAHFARQKTQVFLANDGSLLELSSDQITSMKTDDAEGWMGGIDIETYLRYLYILSPTTKQIYKYERLSNRYGPAVPYNVNGDLTGVLDMSIDGSVYLLSEGGKVQKLLRGEVQPFTMLHVPKDVLTNATRLVKITDGNFYFLDPEQNRIVILTDGGATGEAQYVKQYILEGEQLGTLQDLAVDADQSHLYVIDEKRLYVVDLSS